MTRIRLRAWGPTWRTAASITDAIVWQNQRGNSYTASPVLDEGKLYALTDSGMLSVFDAKTGTRTAFAAT